MGRSVRALTNLVPVARSFAVRGVVEGFYGTPWTHDARREVISFLAPRGMNAYVYAPKDDAKHRAQWRVPYDGDALAQFGDLAAHASGVGVRLGFAISPGLDITYESDDDRRALLAKLTPLRDAGVAWFLLLVDDIPMQPGLAPRQGALATWLANELDGSALSVCPTEYVGTRPSPYLAELSATMPPEADLMWTGPTVCSPRITTDDARSWVKATGDRPVLVWDNTPVNDALMTNSMHLGPYQGRDADLADVVGGVLCNPMTQARASKVALATAMDFFSNPDAYDAAESWARAIKDVGEDRAPALAVLARACADSPIAPPADLDLAGQVEGLEVELDGPGWPGAVSDLVEELRAARALPEVFTPNDALGAEIAPWASSARKEAEAGLAACKLLQQVRPVATVSDGKGRVAPPDPETAMHHAFAVLYVWAGARADEKVVYGPRFAVYTPVIQLADGSPALDAAEAVRENANAIDHLCRFALATYDDWRLNAAGASVRVFVDGDERAVDADGTFDGRGQMVLLRQGPLCTRIEPGKRLPFSDVRLS
jgi:hyaluronoglucosaminidase